MSGAARAAARRLRSGVRYVAGRLLAGAADEPVMALFVGTLVLLALGFLVAGILVGVSLL